MNSYIFISSPYTDIDKNIVKERFNSVTELVVNLLNSGIIVFSPIVYGHEMTKIGLPSDWNFWKDFCTKFIKPCVEVWVLDLDGWDRSTGVKGEIDFAKLLGKKVFLIDKSGNKIKEL
jgi:hypothetical protein